MAEGTRQPGAASTDAIIQQKVAEILAQREKDRLLQRSGPAAVAKNVYDGICFLFGNIGHAVLIALRVALLAFTLQHVAAAYRVQHRESMWEDPVLYYAMVLPVAVEAAATFLLPFVISREDREKKHRREIFFWKNLVLCLIALVFAVPYVFTKGSFEYSAWCFSVHVVSSGIHALFLSVLCGVYISNLLEKPVHQQRFRWFLDTFF